MPHEYQKATRCGHKGNRHAANQLPQTKDWPLMNFTNRLKIILPIVLPIVALAVFNATNHNVSGIAGQPTESTKTGVADSESRLVDRVIQDAKSFTILDKYARMVTKNNESILKAQESLKREVALLNAFQNKAYSYGVRRLPVPPQLTRQIQVSEEAVENVRRIYNEKVCSSIESNLNNDEKKIVSNTFQNVLEYYPLPQFHEPFVRFLNQTIDGTAEQKKTGISTILSLGKNGVIILELLVWDRSPNKRRLAFTLLGVMGDKVSPDVRRIRDEATELHQRSIQKLGFLDARGHRSEADYFDARKELKADIAFAQEVSAMASSCLKKIRSAESS